MLSLWDGNEVVCINMIEASQPISITSKLGQYFPIHAGASGFAVLTEMPFEMVTQIINSRKLELYTPKTLKDPKKLIDRYNDALENGYVISSGERDKGVTSISVGLYLPYEHAYASLAVILPDSRATEKTVITIVSSIIDTKKKIKRYLDLTI